MIMNHPCPVTPGPAMTPLPLLLGDEVFCIDDPKHTGTVEEFGLPRGRYSGKVRVRWHKGFCSWEAADKVRRTSERADFFRGL